MSGSPSEPPRARLLAQRLRTGAAIALAALPAFALADLRARPEAAPGIAAVKLAQLLLLAWTLRAARAEASWARIMRIALVFAGGLTVTAAAADLLRGPLDALPLLLVIATVAPAVLVPWGVRRQLALIAIASATAVGAFALGPGLAALVPFPALPLLVAFVASGYVAAEVDAQRRRRVAAELASRESDERFRALAESAPVLIWVTDAAGACVYLNPEWERLLGHPIQPSESEALWTGVHPEDRPLARRSMEEATAARRAWEAEYRILAADGGYRWLLARGVPRFDPGRRFAGYVGSATDITARKEETVAADAARHAALEAARLKSDFLATLSHEIRTPMHGIFGMTELALDTGDDQERHRYLERARTCAETLMALLDDILDFSRIEAGRLEIADVDLDVRRVLRETLETLSVAATRKGLRLVAVVDATVPAGLRGDPTRLRQVLVNLVGNAVKFTAEGSVEVRMRAEPDGKDGETLLVHVAVRDTGIGIPHDRLPTIFEAFTQVDAVSRAHGGTGLGLAITRRLVDLMGGTIDVESRPGAGSTFTVVVPLARPAPVGRAGQI